MRHVETAAGMIRIPDQNEQTGVVHRWREEFQQQPILLCVALVLAIAVLYGQVARHELLQFDDSPYVVDNLHVRTGLSSDNIAWAFTTFYQANWHPLTWLSHMTDCQLFGLNPGPQHLVNATLHAANVVLLFLLLMNATGAVWRSFLVAALLALHPLNVETVAWIAERKSLLSTLFCLLAIGAYGHYVRQPSWNKYLVIMATFALALMSKPMAVSLPIILLLIDYWPLERYPELLTALRWQRLFIEKIPLFAMSAASSAVTYVAAHAAGGTVADTTALPISIRLENAVVCYIAYLSKTFWPASLAVFYPHPRNSIPAAKIVVSTIILLAITAGVVQLRRIRYLSMGWCFFLITLLPVIGIVQVGHQAMADRYAYVPLIGIFIIIAWGLNDIGEVLGTQAVPAVAAVCMLLVLAGVTNHYLGYWQNGASLFTQARNVAGHADFFLEEPLADALYADGRLGEAVQHYREACSLRPAYVYCHFNMAQILLKQGQLQDALQQYQIALSIADSKAMALSCTLNSGKILLTLGENRNAKAEFLQALKIDPSNSVAAQLLQLAASRETAP